MQISSEQARLKRLKMRSWRRGMKEMDLILGPFAESGLASLDAAQLDAYERLLEENDQELYLWVTGATDAPVHHVPMLGIIRSAIEKREF